MSGLRSSPSHDMGSGSSALFGVWLASFDRVEDIEVEEVETSKAVGLGLAFAGGVIMLGVLDLWWNPPVILTTAALAFGTAFLSDSSRPGRSPSCSTLNPGTPAESDSFWEWSCSLRAECVRLHRWRRVRGRVVFLAVALTGLGLVVAFGPWVRRLIIDLVPNARSARDKRRGPKWPPISTIRCCRPWH